MFDIKRKCEIRIIPKNERLTILGKFEDRIPYLYFTKDGSLCISGREIDELDNKVIYRDTEYTVLTNKKIKYESIGQLIGLCFDIGYSEIYYISKNSVNPLFYVDYIKITNKDEINRQLYSIK